MKPSDQFYERLQEPVKSCLLAMKALILSLDPQLTDEWKYGMPFFCYRGKMCCYLWVHKKYKLPYLGIVEGKQLDDPALIVEKRARMKILLLDPEKDLPVEKVRCLLEQVLRLYK